MKKRIKALAALIVDSDVVADIGTDHAYLLIELFKNKQIKFAYAIDNKDGPIKNATNNLLNANCLDNCQVIKADGLSFLASHPIDTLIFAGIGGLNIIDIIKNNEEKLKNIKYIVTDIHRHEKEVIVYLKHLGYLIDDEVALKEKRKAYHLIRFKKQINKL